MICFSKKEKGFTLAEILISLAVFSLISVIGINYWGNFRQSSMIGSEAQKISGYLRQAEDRAQSGQEGSSWGVYFSNIDSEKPFYSIFFGNSYSAASSTETAYLPSGLKFNDPSSGNFSALVFQRISGLPVSTATIVISTRSNAFIKTISVNSLGQINY